MLRIEREVDYQYNFYKKPHEEIITCKKKNEYNPYVNNSGSVIGKNKQYNLKLLLTLSYNY